MGVDMDDDDVWDAQMATVLEHAEAAALRDKTNTAAPDIAAGVRHHQSAASNACSRIAVGAQGCAAKQMHVTSGSSAATSLGNIDWQTEGGLCRLFTNPEAAWVTSNSAAPQQLPSTACDRTASTAQPMAASAAAQRQQQQTAQQMQIPQQQLQPQPHQHQQECQQPQLQAQLHQQHQQLPGPNALAGSPYNSGIFRGSGASSVTADLAIGTARGSSGTSAGGSAPVSAGGAGQANAVPRPQPAPKLQPQKQHVLEQQRQAEWGRPCSVWLELAAGGVIDLRAHFGFYHPAVIDALSSVNGASVGRLDRVWRFPALRHGQVVAALRRARGQRGVSLNFQDLPDVVRLLLQAAACTPDDSALYTNLPPRLQASLMAFQREGVSFALRHGGRALIADEMGLGKALQAIAVMAAYRAEWPCLIVAPSSLRVQWGEALQQWLEVPPSAIRVILAGQDAKHLEVPRHQFVIVSYDLLPKMVPNAQQSPFRIVVLDESHYIKNSGVQRTQHAVPLVASARRALLLSGTPAVNRPMELFTQISALLPAAKLKMPQFGQRYCLSNNPYDKFSGATNLQELNSVLNAAVMVRRKKADVLTQLPAKRRHQVYLSLGPEADRKLRRLADELEALKAASASDKSFDVGQKTNEMYAVTAQLKAQACVQYVKDLLDNTEEKHLLFAHHKCLLDAMEELMRKEKKFGFIRIDGGTPPEQRAGLVDQFQRDPSCRVAVLSIKAAGAGLTLTAASSCVFCEYSWTPGDIMQAEDRVHRIGQANSVNVAFLHVRHSIDDQIWANVGAKLGNVGQAIDGQQSSMQCEAGVERAAPLPPDQGTLNGFLLPPQPQQPPFAQPPPTPPPQQPPPLQQQAQPWQHPQNMHQQARPFQQQQQRQRQGNSAPQQPPQWQRHHGGRTSYAGRSSSSGHGGWDGRGGRGGGGGRGNHGGGRGGGTGQQQLGFAPVPQPMPECSLGKRKAPERT